MLQTAIKKYYIIVRSKSATTLNGFMNAGGWDMAPYFVYPAISISPNGLAFMKCPTTYGKKWNPKLTFPLCNGNLFPNVKNRNIDVAGSWTVLQDVEFLILFLIRDYLKFILITINAPCKFCTSPYAIIQGSD